MLIKYLGKWIMKTLGSMNYYYYLKCNYILIYIYIHSHDPKKDDNIKILVVGATNVGI